MQTISDHLQAQLAGDITAQEALRRGILNLRAYSRAVRPAVERARGEMVDVATLTVALSRLRKRARRDDTEAPLTLLDLTMHGPLVDITFTKGAMSTRELEHISRQLHSDQENFIAVTQGNRETTIIVPARYESLVTRSAAGAPLYVRSDLYAVTVHFPVAYMQVPNVIYQLVAAVAAHRVNLIEIISTLTELSFIIERSDVEIATTTLHQFL